MRVVMRLAAILLAVSAGLEGQWLRELEAEVPLEPGQTLVIGFLGGWEDWNDDARGVRRSVLALRQEPGVRAYSLSNHHRGTALKLVKRAFDLNRDGRLEPDEAKQARVVVFGHSWGGGATVTFARQLRKLGVPVLLTVQVDSVGKNDAVIPDNVRAAANLYQRELLTFVGEREIRAEDPAKTRILMNEKRSYPFWMPGPRPERWTRRTFGGGHSRMESDPLVWLKVEMLIREAVRSGD
jgi:pimeloyl-ACP methyl ester carboxylesterase